MNLIRLFSLKDKNDSWYATHSNLICLSDVLINLKQISFFHHLFLHGFSFVLLSISFPMLWMRHIREWRYLHAECYQFSHLLLRLNSAEFWLLTINILRRNHAHLSTVIDLNEYCIHGNFLILFKTKFVILASVFLLTFLNICFYITSINANNLPMKRVHTHLPSSINKVHLFCFALFWWWNEWKFASTHNTKSNLKCPISMSTYESAFVKQ